MRGAPTKAIRTTAAEGAMLDSGAHQITLAARHALIMTIERYAGTVPRLNPLALRAVAISGLFADVVCSLSTGPDIVAVVNRQLSGAGLQLVPVARN
jgi:hypothetical protein